jgi:hypothetical protein
MTLIRFEGTSDRGPSGTLWNSLVDWVTGTLHVAGCAFSGTDFFPYNAGDITLSAAGSSAATVSAVPFGVVSFAAAAGTYPGAGYVINEYVDLTSIRQVCVEARLSRTAGATGAEITFIGFSDQLSDAVFDASGGLDGGSGEDTLGLLWNDDLTVDLVSVINSATTVVLIHEVATAISNTGFHKFGLRIQQHSSTKYTIYASVDGAVKKVNVTSSQITQAAMRPVVVTVISATDAPEMAVDWHFVLDGTPGSA